MKMSDFYHFQAPGALPRKRVSVAYSAMNQGQLESGTAR
jgi:hypothetical protein